VTKATILRLDSGIRECDSGDGSAETASQRHGYNGLLTFVISGGDEAHGGAWDILNSGNIIMGGGSTDQASLVVAAPLDREEIASYVLNISVWDQGKPPKFTSKLLQIKVGLSEY
jgi:hypothetical protein